MSQQYRCSNCNTEHTSEEWNKGTAKRLGINLPIPAPLPLYFKDDDSLFFCPSCEEKVYGDELSEVMSGKADDPIEIRIGRSRK